MPESRFTTVTEVSELFRVDPSTVHRWIRDQRLVAIKVGKDYRIERDSVDQLIRESRVSS